MTPRFLLDTHILLRWVGEPHRLSREQFRVLRGASRQAEPLAICDITLLEIAQILKRGGPLFRQGARDIFRELENDPGLHILPLTIAIAREVLNLAPVLRDPADCVIAATARIHGLQLLTSDQRILDANVVSTID